MLYTLRRTTRSFIFRRECYSKNISNKGKSTTTNISVNAIQSVAIVILLYYQTIMTVIHQCEVICVVNYEPVILEKMLRCVDGYTSHGEMSILSS